MTKPQKYVLQLIAKNPETSFLTWKSTHYDRSGALIFGRTAARLAQWGYVKITELRAGMEQVELTEMGWALIDPNIPNCEYKPQYETSHQAWDEVRRSENDPNRPDWTDVYLCKIHNAWHPSVVATYKEEVTA
ncbi:hypothetical protein [Rhodococcus sp. ACS1]|uniref:hypothetical protein n=1 Tax=Rhodococcus sp. ACS1 TaxID=2028570 RepID=UPI00117B660D|nr:hypothetical protein [Rhodococcus sp. ACS1]